MSHLFKGELQLLRWSETSNAGATLTFQLSDVKDLEAFKDLTLAKRGLAGQRIAAMMMLVDELDEALDDTETVYVAYDAPDAPIPEAIQSAKPGQLCVMACNFCAASSFRLWVDDHWYKKCKTEQDAKEFILEICQVKSRKDIDGCKYATNMMLHEVRKPYLEWLGELTKAPNAPS